MVRNIPVDIARETCAEVVIVVNLVEPATPPEKLTQATQLLVRSMEVMLEANERVQLETLTERDIRIDVPMGDIGTADFDRTPETIPLGEAAARSVVSRLAAYAVSEAEYTAWRQHVTTRQDVHATVAGVRFEGLQRVNPEYLETLTTIRAGDVVDIEAISQDALRMSALHDLDSVAYRLEYNAEGPTLVWLPTEASVGHNILRPGLGVYAAGGGDLKFQLGLQHVRTWLNNRGGQWRNSLKVGYESLIATSLYQPFDVGQRFFMAPELVASRSAEDVYDDGERIATYRFIDIGGGVDLGWNINPAAQIRLGYVYTDRRAEARTGDPRLPEIDLRDAGLTAALAYDSRNTAAFATEGFSAAVEYVNAQDSLGSDRDWERIEAGFRTAVPMPRGVMWLSLAGGADLGDGLPADRAFSLGGAGTLPAYQHDELRVREYWLANTNFLWRLKDLVPVKNQVIYAGLGLQAAGLYERVDPVEDGEEFGASMFVGGPTPLGTFTLGAAASGDSWGVWLALGRPIGKGSILDNDLFR